MCQLDTSAHLARIHLAWASLSLYSVGSLTRATGDWTMCRYLAGHPRLACMVAASFKERTWKCASLSGPRLRIDTFPLLVRAKSKASQIQREVKEPPSSWGELQSYIENGPGNQEGNNCANFANQTSLLHVGRRELVGCDAPLSDFSRFSPLGLTLMSQ